MNQRRNAIIGIVLAAVVVTAFYLMRDKNENSKVNIGKSDIRVEDGRFTPEVLWSMGRIGGVAVSPDASKIAYQVSYYSVQENASHTVIYVMDENGENAKLLTRTAESEQSPAWIDNDHIAFLAPSKGL